MIGIINGNHIENVVSEVHAGTMNIDATTGVHHVWSATGNETVNIINGVSGNSIILSITCDATPRTITFGTGLATSVSTFLLTSLKQSVMTLEHNGTTFIPASPMFTLL